MKKNISIHLFTIFTISSLMIFSSVYGQQSVEVSIPLDVKRDCQFSNNCFIPPVVVISPGGTVVWNNDDGESHTITSGSTVLGPDGKFDSGSIMSGEKFSHVFNEVGEYPYFSSNEHWMKGLVIVSENPDEVSIPEFKPPVMRDESGEIIDTEENFSSEGSIKVEITSSDPQPEQAMIIHVKFIDTNTGIIQKNANYNILVTQNEKTFLDERNIHEPLGSGKHTTDPLETIDPFDVHVTILGFGLPNDESNWIGPKGEVVTFEQIPEFGTISIIILGFAVMSFIILNKILKIKNHSLNNSLSIQ